MKEDRTEFEATPELYKVEHFYPDPSSPLSLSEQKIKEFL